MRRKPEHDLAKAFDDERPRRDARAAEAVGPAAEAEPGQYIGHTVAGQGESGTGPTFVLKVERSEGADRAECQCRQRQTGAERRDAADHLRKWQALSAKRRNGRNETRYGGG